MKRYLAAAVLVLAFMSMGMYQTKEVHQTTAAPAAAVGRGRVINEGPTSQLAHPVQIVGRHCQKYMKPDGTVDAEACAKDWTTPFFAETTHNLRTDVGDDWQAELMGKNSTPTVNAQCQYIALTDTAITPGQTDTTLSGEIAANGLSRAQATYAHTSGTSTYTEQKVFSATGTQSSRASGVFTAASSGTMCFEATYTAATVNNGDTLTVTWTINF